MSSETTRRSLLAATSVAAGGQKRYLGGYAFGGGPDERFDVELNRRDQLTIRRGSNFGRSLFHQGGHEFHPAGAPMARIRFAIEGENATSFEIWNPQSVLTANRIAAA